MTADATPTFIGDFTAAVEERRRKAQPAEFELYGQRFKTATDLAGLPYLQFCHAAASGRDTAEMEAGAAQLDLIKGCLDDEDWPRFAELATGKRLSTDQLMGLTQMLIEKFNGGPTSPPSDSASGSSRTTRRSRGGSSQRAASVPTGSSAG